MIFIKYIEEYNPNKKRKTLFSFDDMIADVLSNKKLNPIVTELFILLFLSDNLTLLCQKILN